MKKQRWRKTKQKKCYYCRQVIDITGIYGDFGDGKSFVCCDCIDY